MGEQRDAARTRTKIMEAARDEFAARGFAGGRIDSIAHRAGTSKQLVYHYFASKAVLFEATLESKYEHHRSIEPEEDGPGAVFVRRFRAACADPVWMRFLTWEAAENADASSIVAEGARREAIARQIAVIVEQQACGELPDDLPAELIQLAVSILAIAPIAFAQTTQMITGHAPGDPRFQADWTAFLDVLGQRLSKR